MAAVSRIMANPCHRDGTPALAVASVQKRQQPARTGLGQTVAQTKHPNSATGTSRLKSPAKRPRIGVWTRFNVDKGPRPPIHLPQPGFSLSGADISLFTFTVY
jgi:hypothetical protein